jgi:hypothetical protein
MQEHHCSNHIPARPLQGGLCLSCADASLVHDHPHKLLHILFGITGIAGRLLKLL